MIKKLFYGMMAATMLFATSCQQDDVLVQGGEATISFQVSTPEIATRAFSDGSMATQLTYVVYDNNGNRLADIPEGHATLVNGTATVQLQLAKGNTYNVLFWAANADAHSLYTLDPVNHTLTVNYTDANGNPNPAVLCNDENLDAFYKWHTVTVNGSEPQTVQLRRPFAQLNIGTADLEAAENAGVEVESIATQVKLNTKMGNVLDFKSGAVTGEVDVTFKLATRPIGENFPVAGYDYLAMNYLLVGADKTTVDVEFSYTGVADPKPRTFGSIPVQRNYRTNIYGNLLTETTEFNVTIDPVYVDDNKYGVNADGQTYMKVADATEFADAIADANIDIIILDGNINLNDILTRSTEQDPTCTITAGKTLTIDLNGKKLSATSTQTGTNYNMFDVRGTLTVKNGTMEYEHKGENMQWGNSTNLFNVTAGGVLNLEGVIAKNLGGSDMGFVAHLNNWGEVTLNAENCTLESNYVAVRVFNSGNDMNNVTIKNSTLIGGKNAFWVHNYTVEDFGTQEKADAQKALLNLNIYNQDNTFSPDIDGIRYGFTNSIKTDAYGITKSVSEDGTVVTLGSLVENGLIRRGVAGAEENTTIKKVVVEEGVATLYDRTFRRFYALETVELPSTLTTIGQAGSGVFQSCTALKNIIIPESVTTLGKGSFQECSSLESINIPAGVKRIEADCMRATGLVEVEFHEGVTYFGAQAFRDCKQLKKVVIKAQKFTVEANAFGVTAGTLPGTTIYVANDEMKDYLKSTLAYKNQFTIIAPSKVSSTSELNEALANGEDVVLTDDIAVTSNEAGSNGYGATGISQLNGGTIDGNGNDIKVNAWDTWDSAINTTGGTIKNLNVTGGFRGIFVNHNSTYNAKVILENVTIDGTVYTISCDQGTNKGLEATNCTFNGWTSYAATIGDVKFEGCSFGEGQGYAFCRPYAPTEFVKCDFAAGYTLDACANVTFENCTIGGVALTADNLATLVIGGIANASVK